MNIELKKELSILDLGDLAAILEKQESDLSMADVSHEEKIEAMISELITIRRNKMISRLIKNAELKYSSANINSLDCEAREISKDQIKRLASMGFITSSTNLIIAGPTGAGKTYLACTLGVEACKKAYRTHYVRMPDMLKHISEHRENLREQVRYMKRLGNYSLLIIDEWLNYKINDRESKFIYELIEYRCGNSPTIFVSQYNIGDWHDRLGSGTHADSIMDRIVHNSYEIKTSDTNLRKIYDGKKAQKLIDSIK